MDDPTNPRTRPSAETREAEEEDAQRTAGADTPPTPDQEQRADALELDPEVSEHEREMAERGANQDGEGRLP